jgi:hypothetical protein
MSGNLSLTFLLKYYMFVWEISARTSPERLTVSDSQKSGIRLKSCPFINSSFQKSAVPFKKLEPFIN